MADLGSSIKGIWLKSMEAIGNAASNIATNTKSKVDEINLVNRRAEILRDFGNKAYALWQKGERFPEELDTQLEELSRLDEQLNVMRAERLAGVKVAEEAKEAVDEAADEAAEDAEKAGEQLEEAAETVQDAAEDLQEAAEDAADSVPVIRVENPEEAEKPAADQLSSAINELFDKVPDAQEVTDKVNDALDSLQEGLQSLSSKVDQELDKLDDRI